MATLSKTEKDVIQLMLSLDTSEYDGQGALLEYTITGAILHAHECGRIEELKQILLQSDNLSSALESFLGDERIEIVDDETEE